MVATTQAVYVAARGIAFSPDSRTYARWANELLSTGFDYSRLVNSISIAYPPRLYVAWVTVVAWCQMLFGSHWGVAIVVLNVLANSLVAAMVASLALRTTRSARSGYVAAALSCVAFDLFSWNRFVLSDPTFTALAFSVFYVLSLAILQDVPRGRAVTLAAAVAAVVVFYRPTGIVILPAFGLATLVLLRGDRGFSWVWPSAIAASVFSGVALFAWFMMHPQSWPVSIGRSSAEYTSIHFRMGEVVWQRPDTFHATPATYPAFLSLAIDRVLHFFAFTNRAFSTAHLAGGTLFYLPVYALGLVALATAWREDRVEPRARTVILLAGMMVLVTAAFHGMIQVDYDWRYRTPAIPYLILLASIGIVGSWHPRSVPEYRVELDSDVMTSA